jgi:PAS domain S-box-containing protein
MMDIFRLVSELMQDEDDIFLQWQTQMRKARCEHPRITTRENFRVKFLDVLSVLEACSREPRRPLFADDGVEKPFLAKRILDEAYREQTRGRGLNDFLRDFKTIISCIEDRMADMHLAFEQKVECLLNLRRIADITEIAVVTGLNPSESSGTAIHPRRLDQKTSEKILGAVFMSVGEGILLVDEDFEIVKANQHACEIYGLQPQNIVGADIRSLMETEGAAALERYFEALIEGQRKSLEMICVYVDGKTFPATVTVTRTDLEGKRYWSLIVRDETHQKRMEAQLREEKRQIEEMNLTLKTVMKSIEEDRKDFEKRVAAKIRGSLLPGLRKIQDAADAKVRASYLAVFEEQLLSLTAGFEKELDAGLLRLTRTELEVCRLIQAGRSTKDVCAAMQLSFDTVQTHRKNIRKKLGLRGKKLNLHAFLMNRVL